MASPAPRKRLPRLAALWAIVAAQALCALFFVADILTGVLGLRFDPISWELRELIEIGAGFGLTVGVVMGAVLLTRTTRANFAMEDQIRRASVAFAALLEERFLEWGLTPSERDVAWLTLKGFPIAEIARLRRTSEGTIKAQSNAIYRKSGVSGRTQLLSLFLEDLMDGPRPASTPIRDSA